jgi:hypothetical protein
MSVGTILVGIAVALVVAAYLARPFRKGEADIDRAIETWVAQVHAEGRPREDKPEAEPLSYCPQCGLRVRPDDCFCSGCGMPLQEIAE